MTKVYRPGANHVACGHMAVVYFRTAYQKMPTSSAARAGGRRNVIMSLSPKLPKSHNFEALRANTTSTALEK